MAVAIPAECKNISAQFLFRQIQKSVMSSSGMSCFMYRLSLSDSKKPPKQLPSLKICLFAFLPERKKALFPRQLPTSSVSAFALPAHTRNCFSLSLRECSLFYRFYRFRIFSQRYLHQVANIPWKKGAHFVTVVSVED